MLRATSSEQGIHFGLMDCSQASRDDTIGSDWFDGTSDPRFREAGAMARADTFAAAG
jgi:hypothetical protein